MQRKVKFKGASGFMVDNNYFNNNYHSSGNFHSNEKNKMSESKSKSHLSKTKNNFRNQTKGFPLFVDQMQDTRCIFVILTWLFGDHGLDYFISLPLDS